MNTIVIQIYELIMETICELSWVMLTFLLQIKVKWLADKKI